MKKGWVAAIAALAVLIVAGPPLVVVGLTAGTGLVVAAVSCEVPLFGTVVSASGGSSGSETGSSLPGETIEYLDKQDIKGLAQTNMARYAAAETAEGVPWYVMAALHYREAKMDPNRSISNGAILGTGVNVDGVNVVTDPVQDAINMAQHFKRMADYVYDIDITKDQMTTELWGKAFLAYNRGFLYERKGRTYDQSPYVMNGYDASHMNMRWIDADTVSGFDGNKAGALALMTYLGGESVSSGAGCSSLSTATGSVVPPVLGTGLEISSIYSPARYLPQEGYTRAHAGTDIVGGDGTIVAMMDGKVEWAQNRGGWGYAVKIDHGNGTHTLYGHMVPGSLMVREGEQVVAGQPLGTMGNSGRSYGVHLHLEVWVNDEQIDPEIFMHDNGIDLPHQ